MRNFIKAFSVATFVLLIFLTAGCGGAGNNLPSASGNNEPDPSIDNPTDDPTLSSAKALTSYSILGINGTINQSAKSVSLKVPFGTDLTSLVATFGTTGKSVEVDGVKQESGMTENDFSSPVMYRVFAEDNSSVQYTVTVTAAENSSKTLTDFSLSGVAGIINESDKTVRVQLPSGTDVSSLVAIFGTTGASVEIDGVEQISGVTENDFSSPVTYVIKAADESSIQYIVTVTVAPSEAKEITSFSILGIVGVIDELTKTIQITVPFGTDVSALVPTFATTGVSVEVDGVAQISGVTQNDFNSPVTYLVNAGDSSSVEYTVSVIVAQNTAKEITGFSILGVAGIINEPAKTIAITLPHGTDVTSLVATFSTTAASIKVGVTEQSSGATPNNFTSPVLYTATAADGSVVHYTVTVTVALDSSKAITSYSILGVNGTINEAAKTISITLPYGTSVTNLVATFSITGISAKVGAVAQTSGVTSNNFTSPVTYTIAAENSSTVQYTVTVTVALNSAKQITNYFVLGAAGVINEAAKTIAVTAPYGTNVSALVAQFTTTGASVKVGSTVQVSGVTPNNFNSPVVYTVRAADSSSVQYTVTLTFYVLPLVMNPTSKTLAVGNSFTFSASGGVPPYSFSADNGSINSSTGLYTAPGSAGTAIVTVTDSEARTATATVTINPAISISPNTATLISGESVTFVGAGGVPPYTYSGNSLSINPTTGLLTASVAATGSVTVTDSLGNNATTGDVITRAFVEKDDTYLFCTDYIGNVPNNNDPHGAPHVCWNSVSSIAVDDSGIIYAVGYGFLDNAFSGSTRHWIVKKSTDGGDSWTTVDDYQYYAGGDAAARKVTVDSWGNVTVTGWANNNDGGHWVRLLITRTSSNGGSTWNTSLSGSDNDTVTDASGNIYSITPGSVDPWNSSYYANNPGTGEWVVQKSTDGGISWTTVDYVSPEPGGSQANAIKIDPFGNIYVAGYKTVLSNNSSKIKVWLVRKSIDDGATWTTVDSGGESWPGGIVTNAWHSVIHDMAIDSSGIVYVAANGCSGQCWLVRQSKDEGATWTTIDKVGPLDNSPSGNLNAFAVAVDSDDRPYVGGYSSQLNYKSHWFVRILEP